MSPRPSIAVPAPEGSAWFEFDALVEVMAWGRNDYTVIRVQRSLETAAKAGGTRRVEGSIEDVPVNVGVNRADVLADAFIYVGKGLQRRIGVGPGDVVHCCLRPADPDDVLVADDVQLALAKGRRLNAFQLRTPADRRRLLQPIEEAARPETRERRIAALIQSLAGD